MSYLKRITARERPERVARRAAQCAARLKEALAIASRRAARGSPTVRALHASATVAGVPPGQRIGAGVISFTAPPFRGGLHQFWAWQHLETLSDAEVASLISTSLRHSLQDRQSQGMSRPSWRLSGGRKAVGSLQPPQRSGPKRSARSGTIRPTRPTTGSDAWPSSWPSWVPADREAGDSLEASPGTAGRSRTAPSRTRGASFGGAFRFRPSKAWASSLDPTIERRSQSL